MDEDTKELIKALTQRVADLEAQVRLLNQRPNYAPLPADRPGQTVPYPGVWFGPQPAPWHGPTCGGISDQLARG